MNNFDANNKRLIGNTLFLYLRMFVVLGTNFVATKFVLQLLGTMDYGIYTLIMSQVVCLSFLSSSLAQTTQRFVAFAIGKGNNTAYINKVYSMSLYIVLVISIIFLTGMELVGKILLSKLIIPENRQQMAAIVYHCSILTFIIRLFQVPYLGQIIAYEKMSFFAWFSFFEALFQLIIVGGLYFISFDLLVVYTCLMTFSVFLTFFSNYLYCKIKFHCRIVLSFEKELLKHFLLFSGWNFWGGGCYLAAHQGMNIVYNHFFGVFFNTVLGIAFQVISALSSFVTSFQNAIVPQVTKYYASKELSQFRKLIFRSSRFTSYLVILLVIPIYLNANFLFHLWLGYVPEYLVSFFQILYLSYFFDSIMNPIRFGVEATGKNRAYQILVGLFHLCSLATVTVILYLYRSPILAILGMVIWTLVAVYFRVYCLTKVVMFPAKKFFFFNGVYMLRVLLLTLLPGIFVKRLIPDGALSFLCSSMISVFSGLFCIYFWGLSSKERLYFKTKLLSGRILEKTMKGKYFIASSLLLMAILLCTVGYHFDNTHLPKPTLASQVIIAPEVKYVHFSIDDTISCLKSLSACRKSLFDYAFFQNLKVLHDKFGLRVTLYVFAREDNRNKFQIEDVPDCYKEEFMDNSDWLKFGFHASQPQAEHTSLKEDYHRVKDSVIRFAGKQSWSSVLRLERFYASEEDVDYLKNNGIKCLLCPDDTRLAYDLTREESELVSKEKKLQKNGLLYLHTDFRMESGCIVNVQKNPLVFFTHERFFEYNSSYWKELNMIVQSLHKNNAEFLADEIVTIINDTQNKEN